MGARGVCVDVKKKKKKKEKEKGKEWITGFCDSLGSSQCVEEKLRDDDQEVKRRKRKRNNVDEKSEQHLVKESESEDFSKETLNQTQICFKDHKRKSKRENGNEKSDLFAFNENSEQHLVKESESENFSKETSNGTQVCLKDHKRKSKREKANGKSDFDASKEWKHYVHNLMEDNVGVSDGRSVDASKNLGTENDKNVCLEIYKRKTKRKKGKGKIELSNSLTSKHVDRNIPKKRKDTVVEKSFDEFIEDANDLQEGLLPNLEENGERNEGFSLSKVRDVADCSLPISTRNMNLDGASSDLYASIGRVPLSNTGRKLLVIDLNGILVDIVSFVPKEYRCDTRISKKYLFKRPFCDHFIALCFEKFNIGVWSSRLRKNVDRVVDYVMGDKKKKLLFCWDQSHCTRTGYTTLENSSKPLVLKELRKLWDKHDPDLPWELGEYNQSNTLLLDDSPYKALRNPPNTAVFPAPFSFLSQNDNSLGPEGDLRVYLERLAIAEDVQKYVEQHPFGQRPISSKNPSWGFYVKIAQQKQSCDSTLRSS
ncbi:hypothetical protein Scep_016460 [Stephania cephalantha]|uniref:Mitochondrial import inner membrane translocase subunit TIM50 n=1 Tax=Stephania cephalantha TaxID=152367 RepID=A0AAP0IPL4_9MAGN